jgi:hypothetical protein
MGTFYGFGVDEFSSVTGDGAGPFDFSKAVYIDAGGFGSIPGVGLSYSSFGNGAFDTGAYDSYFGNYDQSAAQLAGIGLSLTSDLGGGGFTSYANYDFTPGQTSSSVFDYYGGVGYSPSVDYSGNGYVFGPFPAEWLVTLARSRGCQIPPGSSIYGSFSQEAKAI